MADLYHNTASQGSDFDCDGAVRTCEKEKFFIAKEVQRLKEEMAEVKCTSTINWREALGVFGNAEKDLLRNLDQSSDLKSMHMDLKKELHHLANEAGILKRKIMVGDESAYNGERKTRMLNEKYTEKQSVINKVDSTLRSNLEQQELIIDALRGVVSSLVKKLYDEKIKYCDLKFNMCSFLQEYHKMKQKYKDAEKMIKSMTDMSPRMTTNTNNTVDITGNRTLKDLLTDIDTLAHQKLSSIGLKPLMNTQEIVPEQVPDSKIFNSAILPSNGLSLPRGVQSPDLTEGGIRIGQMTTPTKKMHPNKQSDVSIFKDRSLDISRTSRISGKSNLSKRYQQKEDDDDESDKGLSEEEQLEEVRSINKYQESYYDRSQCRQKSGVSSPDRSLTKVRGISPIGTRKEGNSCFLSPER